MKPSVLRQQDLVQLSYTLPHRTFATRIYPSRSPNGSTIIIYGHEQGLRVVWYGGKPFKSPRSVDQPTKVNGTSKDDPMVIDLDEDETGASQSTNLPADFEDQDDEVDLSQPYRNVLRYIDVSFGTNVLHLAVPSILPDAGERLSDSYPPLFSDRMVMAASCGDLSIRVVALPLAPPSPLATNPATWNLQVVKIFGSGTHQDQITSISITHTAETLESEGEGEQSKSRSRSRNRLASTTPKPGASKEWSILIASISCTGTGLLLVHQIPVTKNNTLVTSTEILFPIQRQFLRSSLSRSVISFNPSPYPAERHSNLLIALPDAGCVKIYQVFPSVAYQRGRRGSATTIESSASSLRSAHGVNAQIGKFLITMYPGFLSTDGSDSMPRRKYVLDASWVLGGRAIVALLEDGEWGVWDLEAAGPLSASTTQNLVQGQNNVSGIQGGSVTQFAIRALVGRSAESATKPSSVGGTGLKAGLLAPLTPHTRKMRSDGLFQGASLMSTSENRQGGVSYGNISVTDHPSNSQATTKLMDESVILSFRESNVFIPSILAYWRSETTATGSFDSSSSVQPSALPPLHLGGEQQHSIAQLPHLTTIFRNALFGSAQLTPPLLVATDHRLIILAPAVSDATGSDTGISTLSLPARPLNSTLTSSDQLLLTQGQLDVDGMDRILNGMASGNTAAGSDLASTSAFGKSVGFQIDDDDNDVEMGMGTPTPKNRHGRVHRLGPSTRSEPRERLFS